MRKLFATLSVILILFGSFGPVFAMAAVGAPFEQSTPLQASNMQGSTVDENAARDSEKAVKLCIVSGSSHCGVSAAIVSWPAFAKIAFQPDPFFMDGTEMRAVFTDMETPPPRS